MTTNDNNDQAADPSHRLFVDHAIPDAEDHVASVIGSEEARIAYHEVIEPIVSRLNMSMKEELGRDYSVTLTPLEKYFDDNWIKASISLSGPAGRASTIQLFVDDEEEGSVTFTLLGSEIILKKVSFKRSKGGISLFYEIPASYFPEMAAYEGCESVRFDAAGDLLAFIADEVTAFLGDELTAFLAARHHSNERETNELT